MALIKTVKTAPAQGDHIAGRGGLCDGQKETAKVMSEGDSILEWLDGAGQGN